MRLYPLLVEIGLLNFFLADEVGLYPWQINAAAIQNFNVRNGVEVLLQFLEPALIPCAALEVEYGVVAGIDVRKIAEGRS